MTLPSPPSPSSLHPWQVIGAGICALVLTVGLARFAYTPLLPLMRADAGLSAAQGGWLATFNYLGYLFGTLLVARVGDPQRRFRFYRAGLLLAVAATALMGCTTRPWLWSVLRFIAGMSSTAGLLLASTAAAGDLQVDLHGIRAHTGTVRLAVVDSAAGWDGKAAPVQAQSLPATADA
ncbi:YbfB/YjiJ family MFS transporter, partial [Stenotrophomonas sp.]|uniref:YbfB/YjiJ family MFS transporter n=1 Tax=Stenotrophomonas sp. TaxID=69392 RepID=UPI00289B74E8